MWSFFLQWTVVGEYSAPYSGLYPYSGPDMAKKPYSDNPWWGGGGHKVGTPFTTHALLCSTRTARQNDRADRLRGIVHIQCRPPFTVSMSSCCQKRVRARGDSLTHTHGAPRRSLGAPRGGRGAPSGFFWLDSPGTLWNPPWCTSAPLLWPQWRPALSPTSPVCDRRTGAPQCHATVTTARS